MLVGSVAALFGWFGIVVGHLAAHGGRRAKMVRAATTATTLMDSGLAKRRDGVLTARDAARLASERAPA
jgi:uncharacterized protein with FMN-binding domain